MPGRDSLGTTWDAEPHTLAKHEILSTYLKAWFPILSRATRRHDRSSRREVLYVDGFAGPGRYTGGEVGSPVLALNAARGLADDLPLPVRFAFVEEDPERHASLCEAITSLGDDYLKHPKLKVDPPVLGDAESVVLALLQSSRQRGVTFGPALVFLDQCGYGQVPMSLVRRILEVPECEVLLLLEYRDINRFLSDSTKHATISRAFGDDRWMVCTPLGGPKRYQAFRESYSAALKDNGGATYVQEFAMLSGSQVPLYWLFFATRHIRGLEEMKKAMWSVDKRGTFRFSDSADPAQLSLLPGFDDHWLADSLASHFAGKTCTTDDVYHYTVASTPCYKWKTALAQLEKAGRVRVEGRAPKSRGYGDRLDLKVTFR